MLSQAPPTQGNLTAADDPEHVKKPILSGGGGGIFFFWQLGELQMHMASCLHLLEHQAHLRVYENAATGSSAVVNI